MDADHERSGICIPFARVGVRDRPQKQRPELDGRTIISIHNFRQGTSVVEDVEDGSTHLCTSTGGELPMAKCIAVGNYCMHAIGSLTGVYTERVSPWRTQEDGPL